MVEFFQLNPRVAPFDDVRVRRALNFAFDRGTVVSRLGGEIAATPTCQVLPPGVRGYRRYCPYTRSPRADGRWTAPDVERAQRLVDAPGTRGALVAVWGVTDDPTLGPPVTKLMASTLRRLGYRTRLCLVPSSFRPIPDGCDPARIQSAPPGGTTSSRTDTSVPGLVRWDPNNRGLCDPRLDARMDKARSLEVTAPRAAALAWAEIDREVADRALWVPIVNTRMIDFVSPRVRNYQFHPYWGFLASQAWL